MIALLLVACAAPLDPCVAVQDALVACEYDRAAFECDTGDTENAETLACMANRIECDTYSDSYRGLTDPAFAACAP